MKKLILIVLIPTVVCAYDVRLKWNHTGGADKFQIYRAHSSGDTIYKNVSSVRYINISTMTSYVSGLNGTHVIYVKAIQGRMTSTPSNTVKTVGPEKTTGMRLVPQ